MMTEGGTIQWPELRARGWSRKTSRQFLPSQRGKVDTHVFDLATIVQAEARPDWQAKKAAIVENAEIRQESCRESCKKREGFRLSLWCGLPRRLNRGWNLRWTKFWLR
jgi:hypothetical protein